MDYYQSGQSSATSARTNPFEMISKIGLISAAIAIILFVILTILMQSAWYTLAFSIIGLLLGVVSVFHPASPRKARLWGIASIALSAPVLPFLFGGLL